MLHIEIVEKEGFRGYSTDYFLVVNGIEDKKGHVFLHNIGDTEDPIVQNEEKTAYIVNEEVISIINNDTFDEFSKFIAGYSYLTTVHWWNYGNIEIIVSKPQIDENNENNFRLTVGFMIDNIEHWNKPWSIFNLKECIKNNILLNDTKNMNYYESEHSYYLPIGFSTQYKVLDATLIISSVIDELYLILEGLLDKTNKDLLASIDSEAVLTYFHFPEEIKTACKQYLVYFAQFIADMGINVDTDLKEELNYTLFKITPKNREESLERIREALNIYINAPAEKDFTLQLSNQTDIAVKQWEANFYHLKSQLALATSLVQAKDATIEALQISNYQYKQIIESNNSNKEVDKEEIIKGVVAVSKYEGKGVSINLPEILRRLKRMVS
jgi:hypothetical protein